MVQPLSHKAIPETDFMLMKSVSFLVKGASPRGRKSRCSVETRQSRIACRRLPRASLQGGKADTRLSLVDAARSSSACPQAAHSLLRQPRFAQRVEPGLQD